MIKPHERLTIPITDLLNSTDYTSDNITLDLVEIINGIQAPRFIQSRQSEYDCSVAKRDVRVVNANSISVDANIIDNSYVLCIKNMWKGTEKCKARWILQGYHN